MGVTLRRAWEGLEWKERLKWGGGWVKSWGKEGVITDEENQVERLREMLKEESEQLYRVLVDERDGYLAWSCKRSRAVRGKKVVVGIVGRGHVKGVGDWIRRDNEERSTGGGLLWFKQLVGRGGRQEEKERKANIQRS